MPTLSTTAADEDGAVAVLRASWRRARAAGAAAGRAAPAPLRRARGTCSRMFADRRDRPRGRRRPSRRRRGPRAATSRAVSRSRTSRCSGVCTTGRARPAPRLAAERVADASHDRLARAARATASGSRSVLATSSWISAEQVVAQPGHRGELHAVGLLVQADPEPEVVGSTPSSRSTCDDVGRDQQQPARASPPVRGTARTGRAPCRTGRPSSAPTSTPVTSPPTERDRARTGACASSGELARPAGRARRGSPSALA